MLAARAHRFRSRTSEASWADYNFGQPSFVQPLNSKSARPLGYKTRLAERLIETEKRRAIRAFSPFHGLR